MAEAKSIVTYQTREYGVVKVKLAALMDRRGITRNRLRTLTGIKYDVIDRCCKTGVGAVVDRDLLATVCYVLDCRVEDVLEYEKPAESAP